MYESLQVAVNVYINYSFFTFRNINIHPHWS